MCRWLAYSGSPVRIEELLYKPKHSLIDQSLHSQLGAETTNGDGFGVGWYGPVETPGVFHSIEPAWNDRNLRELAAHIESPLVFAHIRASTGSPVQQTNCHPFRHGRWLWMHNGLIGDFRRSSGTSCSPSTPRSTRRSRARPTPSSSSSWPSRSGSRTTRRRAVERAVGVIEHIGDGHGVEHPDPDDRGDERRAGPLGVPVLQRRQVPVAVLPHRRGHAAPQHPDNPVLHRLSDESRLVVSEPLGDLAGAWNEVPESSYGIVQEGQDVLRPFNPHLPPGWTDRADDIVSRPGASLRRHPLTGRRPPPEADDRAARRVRVTG